MLEMHQTLIDPPPYQIPKFFSSKDAMAYTLRIQLNLQMYNIMTKEEIHIWN